jgi:bifunctional UDP-N-acetylglucosamine pyrophosphorylase/glucosamine-1-phosphate N-acetyltransferase
VSVTVIVLAAGVGKRMKSALPKVMHPLLGVTMLDLVLRAAEPLRAVDTLVVVGHRGDEVETHLRDIGSSARAVWQAEQRGTGNAVRTAIEQMQGELSDVIVVINGDTPLIRPETLQELVRTHVSTAAAATFLTAEMDDPTGYGRIIRGPGGEVEGVVEHRDTTPQQRAVREVNAGVYVFNGDLIGPALNKMTTTNDQGEELLVEVLGLLAAAGHRVSTLTLSDHLEALGCNDRVELATLRAHLRDRVNNGWMREGVSIVDPYTTWIDVTVTLTTDAVIEPNTHLRGNTEICAGAVVGPDTTLIDVRVGERAEVVRTHAIGAVIGAGAHVGPYAYLRPGTVLHHDSKVGTFVEVKNSEVGPGTKIPHLSYVGDATIGEESNIGAANVVVNYDGVAKHRTVIGSHVRTGSDTMLVAPVTVGDGAYTAAGSVITKDVPPGALGVGRAQQRNVEGWVARRRPGTASAAAAEAAQVTSAEVEAEGGASASDTSPE